MSLKSCAGSQSHALAYLTNALSVSDTSLTRRMEKDT